ncbi:MAG: bifunctional metallophosphatase/5'-nucleotidase [Treponema sp.]|jgi:5'-nucleotidase/5'-nucleotidase/UDP-sugar diphosphatase|nr:bifunctional metallophosphatase/5'-nucleotidase [Treponema sp.]
MTKKAVMVCIALLAAVIVTNCATTSAKAEAEFDLTIFHTGDTHGHGLDAPDRSTIGYAKTLAYVNQFRNGKNGKDVLFLDAGDALYGTSDVNLSLGESNLQAMNMMGYDAFTLGNADFVYGGQQTLKLQKEANFPFLSANVYYNGQRPFNPYIIKNFHGVSIAIVGLSPLSAMVAALDTQLEGFTATNGAVELAGLMAELKKNADIIIALTHIGKLDTNENDEKLNVEAVLAAAPDIDVIIDGHDHILVSEDFLLHGKIMVNIGQYSEHLGVLTLTINPATKTITGFNEQILDPVDFENIAPDAKVAAHIATTKAENARYLNEVVAHLSFELEGRRQFVRSKQTSLGSVMTDAERELAQSDVDFTVGAFLRESLPAGDITRGQIINSVPFTAPLVTRLMTGRQLVDFIEHNYTEREIIVPSFTHISGMNYTVDFSRPAGDRMTDIKIGGIDIDLDKQYAVSCNEQVSDYGIREIPIASRIDKQAAEILVDYLSTHQDIEPPTERVLIN